MTILLDAHIQLKRYERRTVLRDLHVQVRQGELVSLVGASGCGKSTLLRLIAGLDADYSGTIALDGQPRRGTTRDVGFIFQEPRLFPWLSVARNIAFDITGSDGDHPRVNELLAEVGLQGLGDALPKQLSGGQAQRVAIARGLFRRPRLLLLDEPFSAVDAFTRMKLQDLLRDVIHKHGVTALMVTHDLDEAVVLSDRVIVLDQAPGPVCASLDIALPHPRRRDDAELAQARSALFHRLQQAHAL